MSLREQIVSKVLSGRLYLTIIAGAVFAYATWKNKIATEAITSIITMVFTLYFTRTDRAKKEE